MAAECGETEYQHKHIKGKDWVKGTAEIFPPSFSVTSYEVFGILQRYCSQEIKKVVIHEEETERTGKGTDK